MRASSKSRIANGKALHAFADGRTREARRWRDLFLSAMHRTGGKHEQLCRSIASLTLRHEQLDARLARGEDVDSTELVKLSGAIGRAMVRAGLTADNDFEDGTAAAIEFLRASHEARP